VTQDWLEGRGPFDGILENIQPDVLVPLMEGFVGALRPGGWLILSGITEEEWLGVSRSAAQMGFGIEDVDAEGEWRSGWFMRPVD
jgi:ribosomal protein L11 methylase PrmA